MVPVVRGSNRAARLVPPITQVLAPGAGAGVPQGSRVVVLRLLLRVVAVRVLAAATRGHRPRAANMLMPSLGLWPTIWRGTLASTAKATTVGEPEREGLLGQTMAPMLQVALAP